MQTSDLNDNALELNLSPCMVLGSASMVRTPFLDYMTIGAASPVHVHANLIID